MKRAFHFILIVLFFQYNISTFAQGGKQHVQNFETKQPSRFTENKGQVTDQNGKLRNDVKYIYSAPGFKAIFKANSFSYEIFTVDKKPKLISEATGKPVNKIFSLINLKNRKM